MLTDKAKTDFEKWLTENDHAPWVAFFDTLPDVVKFAYIIEWLDIVHLHINTFYVSEIYTYSASWEVTRCVKMEHFKTRTEAVQSAIIKANELYNLKHQ